MSRNEGTIYTRVYFKVKETLKSEKSFWAETDLVPTYRNYARWKDLLVVGNILGGINLRGKQQIDADSPIKLVGTAKIREDEENHLQTTLFGVEQKPQNDFDFEQWLQSLESGKSRTNHVVALFFREKGIKFDTKEEAESALRRHLKPAKEVARFPDEKIIEKIDLLKKEFPPFTVETIWKHLTK